MLQAIAMSVLHVQDLASKVLHGITQLHSSTRFNGVHLRIENDAVGDWAASMRGRARMYQMYKQHMIAAGFDASTLVYVASGMLKSSTSGDPHPRDFLQRMAHDLVLSKVRSVRSCCVRHISCDWLSAYRVCAADQPVLVSG